MARLTALALLFAGVGAAPALADEYVDRFDGGGNPSGWTFGPGDDPRSDGGNPGGYLGATTFDYAVLRTNRAEVFLGDWRVRNVTDIRMDHVTFARLHGAWSSHPMYLMLYTDNGTPGDETDDWAAYYSGAGNVPAPGEGWRSFHWNIPAQDTVFPAGWQHWDLGSFPPAEHDWNVLISRITQVAFWTITPGEPTNFPGLVVGADNILIDWFPPPCLGDLDLDGRVSLADLATLLVHFGSLNSPPEEGDLDADADVDLADLALLLTVFGQPCR